MKKAVRGVRGRAMRRKTFKLVRDVLRMRRGSKRALVLLADAVAIPLALWTAMTLRFGTPYQDWSQVGSLYVVAPLLTLPVFIRLGLYRAVIRFMGIQAAQAIFKGVVLSTLLLAAVSYFALGNVAPAEVFVIYGVIAALYAGTTRFAARELFRRPVNSAEPVAIYGAGAVGAQLCSALSGRSQFRVAAFLDDSAGLRGARVYGIQVFSPEQLPEIRKNFGVSVVLLALPNVSRRRRSAIVDQLTRMGFKVQTVPNIAEIISGQSRVEEVRDIDVHDLLGRDPVPPNRALLGACIQGKSILVTGAGGSIGSELCRQILELAPRRLVLFEASELALYEIERELRSANVRNGNRIELVALLGNAHHKHRVREIMSTFGIQTVYHAAAYKHVPIVEHNIVEGIHNNIFATYNTAEAAMECRVETFVLISTDKAVNPTNVMGCTKRVAEMVLQGLQQRGGNTRFCMVRFGNVLESSGSVVPLFREQIREGGPVTVTHPDVIRYFMTIPEAAQLVIQAGSMGSGGDVFVLDMGSPVRIADLAKRMIQLAGYTVRDEKNPDGDIEIRFTGLRPAEKLFEELLIGKNVTGTEHPRILRAMEHSLPWDQMRQVLDDLAMCSARFDCERVREVLLRAVPEYRPAEKVQDHVWLLNGARVSGAVLADDEKVRELRPRTPA
jgi:FlaA1/EpsC-like NDP-sugar epimerase